MGLSFNPVLRQQTAIRPGSFGLQSRPPRQAGAYSLPAERPTGVPRGYVLPGLRFGGAQQKVADFEAQFRRRTGFNLDPFQREALGILYEGKSPIVAAATSSGKTLVAEAAIQDGLQSGKRVFYTAPRKAISNFMFNEFQEKYGRENIGLMTGDVTVNPDAPVVLMTTEIFRNKLYEETGANEALKNLKYVVFDECHFINDPERGHVWEEAALYARKQLPEVQQIHLSATVGNPEEYRDWLNSLDTGGHKAGEFVLVSHPQRPVPLKVQYLSRDNGSLVDVLGADGEPTAAFEREFRRNGKDARLATFDPVFTVKALKRHNRLPLIEFVFSRNACNENAQRVLDAGLDLVGADERAAIGRVIAQYVDAYPSLAASRLLPFLEEGIAYHHADMWPREKELVEALLKKKLLKAVFATTTLAEGVNVPAQTVGISALEIRRHAELESITGSDFQQMSGRAGRRGMFEQGYVVLAHPQDNNMGRVLSLIRSGPASLKSRFQVNPHMALQLLERLKDPARINILLEEGFRAFQIRRELPENLKNKKLARTRSQKANLRRHQQKASALGQEFKAMRQYLIAAGFVREDNTLTRLGKLAGRIPVEANLLVAMAIERGLLDNLAPPEIAALLAATVDDPASQPDYSSWSIEMASDDLMMGRRLGRLKDLESELLQQAQLAGVTAMSRLAPANVDVIARWCRTHDASLLEASPGRLNYTILRTAGLLGNIEQSGLIDAPMLARIKKARSLLLDGVVAEQLQPGRQSP